MTSVRSRRRRAKEIGVTSKECRKLADHRQQGSDR
jgi:hypothetical protein